MKITVKFLKDKIGIYNVLWKKDSKHELIPYEFYYRGWIKNEDGTMKSTENDKTYVVCCYGQGEFDQFIVNEEIELL